MLEFLRGVVLGLAIVLPGISGGTAALAMGIYQDLLQALARLRFRPHLRLGAGLVPGVLGGAWLVSLTLKAVPDVLASFLLGVILATALLLLHRVGAGGWPRGGQAVLGGILLLGGFGLAYLLAGERLAETDISTFPVDTPLPLALVGGMFSSSAMVLPGMSGGTVLVMLGLYDDALAALTGLDIPVLAAFVAGSLVGLFGVSRLANLAFLRWPSLFRLFLAGLVAGSHRAVLPGRFGLWEALALGAGFLLVWRSRE